MPPNAQFFATISFSNKRRIVSVNADPVRASRYGVVKSKTITYIPQDDMGIQLALNRKVKSGAVHLLNEY